MFVGRERELALLEAQLQKKTAQLIVIRGRRRIGKSRLVQEFSKRVGVKTLTFSGILPVKKTTAQSQREEFARQMQTMGIPGVKADDWGNLFWHLAQQTQNSKVIIFLDEISWMGTKDFDFLGKLKNAWDLHFSNNPDLTLILCGSVSSWIEEKILNNPAFLGRISLKMHLDELPLYVCNKFWGPQAEQISAYDKLKMLSVTGGVPRYLEEIQPRLPADDNIRALCFQKEGLLFSEFNNIFADLFNNRSVIYEKIVQILAKGHFELEDLYRELGIKKSGKISLFLKNLILAGFVSRDFTWHVKDGKESKLSKYRLRDNYLRFYCKFIAPNKSKIERDEFLDRSLATLPGWDSLIALQFENLVLQNRKSIQALLGLQLSDIVCSNPYFQRKTEQQEGCQVDYMIQTRHNFLYVVEIKFSRKPIPLQVVDEMKQKIERIKMPKHFSRLPVLIHVCGVEEEVLETGYFAHVIDFGSLLTQSP
ncbi:MAG: ATPase [Verrucomicrobia bacterium]|nr:ATPase [Verrucomicrobiota bacterium]